MEDPTLLPPLTDATATSARPTIAATPDHIGAYRILGILGRGGMGVVYRAEQANPRRQVALKIIGASFVSDELLKRFDREANVLGRLKHPGVAQIYEAGTSDTGHGPQPFYAMELVDGAPLIEYTLKHKLDLRQRLELLMRICEAVQYAHQQGVIHRDLKPGNILVTEEGQPKILDFGVARAMESDVQLATMQTDIGQLVGTLPYMSPEQAGGNSDEIDTRSDVYALGVIAYELLGGRLPYKVQGVALPEAVRVIREEEPSRLSSIDKTYRGDIETIVGKALEKDKTRRYQTANALAADVKRFLDYEPITARPPSAWYQISKFARRNKALVGGVIATMFVLLAGAIVSFSLYVRAEHQRRQAQEERDTARVTLDFLTDDILSGATPEKIPDAKVREQIVNAMITPAAAAVGTRFKDRPLAEASVRNAIAIVLEKVGRPDLALPHAELAWSIRRRVRGEDHADTLLSLEEYAFVLAAHDKAAEAEPLRKRALERNRRVLGDDHQRTLLSLSNYASTLWKLNRAAEAEPLYKEALERGRRVLGPDNPDTIRSLNSYGLVLRSLGRTADAEAPLKDAWERRLRVLGPDNPETITSLNNYASLLEALGRASDAEPMLKQALERRRQVLGEHHPATIASLNNYAIVLYRLGRVSDAEPLTQQALAKAMANPNLGPKHPQTAKYAQARARCLNTLGRNEEAADLRKQFGLPEATTAPTTKPATAPATTPRA